jgi:hypothetical protein
MSNDPTAKMYFETDVGRPVAKRKWQWPLLSNTVAEMPAATAAVTTAAAKTALDVATATADWDAVADTDGDCNAENGDWVDSLHSPRNVLIVVLHL